MASLELHKSTWADAQRLISSWGLWGHTDGPCSAPSCRYDIWLEDAATRTMAWPIPEHLWPAYREAFRIYSGLGGRASTFELTFLVRDGLIVRAGAYAGLDVPPRHAGDDDGYGLIAKVVSMPQLSRDGESIHLEDDPDYVVVRPGGCEPCMEATLVYSDHAPQEKVRRVTMIEPTCLAGPRNCTTVEDLLPASAPFHLYDDAIGARPEATTVPNITQSSPLRGAGVGIGSKHYPNRVGRSVIC